MVPFPSFQGAVFDSKLYPFPPPAESDILPGMESNSPPNFFTQEYCSTLNLLADGVAYRPGNPVDDEARGRWIEACAFWINRYVTQAGAPWLSVSENSLSREIH